MKKQTTMTLEITADTYIEGVHTKKGTRVQVDGENGYLLLSNNKARPVAEEETKKK